MPTSPAAVLTRPAASPSVVSGGAANLGRLVMRCPDRPGIIAAVAQFLAAHDANIVESNQATTDPTGGEFFLRMAFHRRDLALHLADMEAAFVSSLVEDLGVTEWHLVRASEPKRVAIMVSRYDHCLVDLLWRADRGDLPADICMVISNHPDLAETTRSFGVPFVHIPVTRDTKAEAEAQQLALLRGNVGLVVMARYMQILSDSFLDNVGCPVINIHHSFLPAFIGASPYQQAKQRGVKLIGATAHYATADLDEGPIIEQDVVRVNHGDGVPDLTRRGQDVERTVLSRAVLWHCEDRVIRHDNSTVVFPR